MTNNSPQTNVVLGLDGNMYKLDTAFKRGVAEQVIGQSNYAAQSCLMEDEDGKIYNILDLLAGNKVPLTPEQIKGYPMSPKSGIVSNHDGTIGSLVTAFLEAGGTLSGKTWIPYFLPDGKLAWKDYLDGLNPPSPTNIKGEKGIDGLNFKICDTDFAAHTTAQLDAFAVFNHMESFDKTHILTTETITVGGMIGLMIQNSDYGTKSLYLGYVSKITGNSIECYGRYCIHTPKLVTHSTITLGPDATYNAGTLKMSVDNDVVNVNGYIDLKSEWHMGETMLTLPVGFRPTNLKSISMWLNNIQVRFAVGTDGQLTFLETMSGTLTPAFKYSFHFSFIR